MPKYRRYGGRKRKRTGKRKFRRRVKRRLFRRRRRRTLPVLTQRGGAGGFPERGLAKLPYWCAKTLDTGVSNHTFHLFRLNSVFDPDQSGTGLQPVGYDEFNAIYEKYTVNFVKFSCKFVNTSNTALQVFLLHTNDANPGSDVSYSYSNQPIRSGKKCRARTLLPQNSGNGNACVLSMNIPIKRIYKELYTTRYDATTGHGAAYITFGANPSTGPPQNNVYGLIGIKSVDGSLDVTCHCEIRLTYYVTLFNGDLDTQYLLD